MCGIYQLPEQQFGELLVAMKGQLELLLTVLAVRLLERERAAECSLMIRKGKEWIRKAMARFGVASEQLEAVTSRL